jgi:oxalate decarboxylase/phosphoglucose isomerase-like protein (cupin superfamily)
MKVYNINQNIEPKLGRFQDDRGIITDIFYGLNVNHGCIITNTAGAVRGNHYHKNTTQYTYVLSGSMTYYSQSVDSSETVRSHECQPGDFVISPPNEIHAMRAGTDGCVFIAFAGGPRGGEDYESDTYRVESIVR